MAVQWSIRTAFLDFSDAAPSLAALVAAIRGYTASFASSLATCLERQRQRHQLAALDDHALRDIGITRTQALHEAEKLFWN
jgi:uncharacterized protein YjiS (DUF1127 family)